MIGKYTVNSDCSATMSLNTGETFNAVLADSGKRVLFIESDSTGGGSIGELDLATTACVSAGSPRTFAFSFFGAMPASAPTTSTVDGHYDHPDWHYHHLQRQERSNRQRRWDPSRSMALAVLLLRNGLSRVAP